LAELGCRFGGPGLNGKTVSIRWACRETVHPERWKQIVREGDAAPAWLAEDFGADRRRPPFSPISSICRNGVHQSVGT
jgi:hypothetical protein